MLWGREIQMSLMVCVALLIPLPVWALDDSAEREKPHLM